MSKKITLYREHIITENDIDVEQQAVFEIMQEFSEGFKSVQLAVCKKGAVPEFKFFENDKPLTYYDEKEKLDYAKDKNKNMVIPEMTVLVPKTIAIIKRHLKNLEENFKSERTLIISYWYKIPLIGILILRETEQDKDKKLLFYEE